MAEGKSAAQIEALMTIAMEGRHPGSTAAVAVRVTPTGSSGAWGASLIPIGGEDIPSDWERSKISIQQALRGDFYIASED